MEITTRIGCRNNCAYCPQEKLVSAYAKRSKKLVMSFDTFKTCLDKIPKSVRIDFSGMAEPFLNPDCVRMVGYAALRGYKVCIYTTLVGLTREALESLRGMDFELFVVHLPSTSKDMQIEITDEYLDLVKAAKGIKGMEFLYFGELDTRLTDIIKGSRATKGKINSRADNVDLNAERLASFGTRIGDQKAVPSLCGMSGRVLDHNVLLPDGDVLICCMDYGMRHVIGNLLDDDYEALFRSAEYGKVLKGLREADLEIICATCANRRKDDAMTVARIYALAQIRASGVYKFARRHGVIRW